MSVRKVTRRKKGSGHIYKVKDTFYLQYRDANHKRCSITLKTASGKKITEEREARAAAKNFLERQQKIQEIETREEYLEKRAKLKKLKARLTITLEDAFDLHLQKPHTRIASQKVLTVSRRYWEDFVAFLQDQFELKTLDQVDRIHAEAYIAYIRKNGRYDVMIRYNKETAPRRKPFKKYQYGGPLSNTTLNRYQSACKAVFTFLSTDLGYTIEENPFFHIKPLKIEPVAREIFSDEELSLIFKNPPPLMKALFTIGICTGLRLGDVATLCWNDIEIDQRNSDDIPIFFGKEIHRLTRKTKALVHIPIEYELADFLQDQWLISGNEEYVIPEAAEMYLGKSHPLNNRILSYIKSLGIEKCRIIPGRKRKQSVKDFHSLRHCFCYYAGIRGVPLPIVQSIVGHLTPAMTKHYQSHADRIARKQGIALMRGLISKDGISPQTPKNTSDVLRDRIIQFVHTATEIQILQLNVIIDKLASNELTIETNESCQDIPERKLITTS
ncbi:MAG: tyrosine-type recombinase/integrase [Victivallaceae bacterium]